MCSGARRRNLTSMETPIFLPATASPLILMLIDLIELSVDRSDTIPHR